MCSILIQVFCATRMTTSNLSLWQHATWHLPSAQVWYGVCWQPRTCPVISQQSMSKVCSSCPRHRGKATGQQARLLSLLFITWPRGRYPGREEEEAGKQRDFKSSSSVPARAMGPQSFSIPYTYFLSLLGYLLPVKLYQIIWCYSALMPIILRKLFSKSYI